MSKKWPVNPKYQNIKPVVDSGSNVRKYLENIEELHRNFKFSKDEIFRRIKLDTFIRLLMEVWTQKLKKGIESYAEEQELKAASEASLELSDSSTDSLAMGDTLKRPNRATTSRSTLNGVISGIGELDFNEGDNNTRSAAGDIQLISDVRPYLLLDVRDLDDFNQWHIKSARNYQHTMLSRVMNYETKDLLTYKNKPGYIIVLYDEDETLSQKVATTFVQRGYDNIYLLSGGLNLAWRRFDNSLICGSPPKTSSVLTDRAYKNVLSSAGGSSKNVANNSEEFTTDDLNRLEKGIANFFTSTAQGFKSGPSTNRSRNSSIDTTHYASSRSHLLTSGKPWK